MKTRMVQVSEGELLGPVDWSYNFHGAKEAEQRRTKEVDEKIEMLRRIADNPRDWLATFDHSDAECEVLAVGMYDGWPWWRPVPSVCFFNVLGAEWHSWTWLREVRPQPQTGAAQ